MAKAKAEASSKIKVLDGKTSAAALKTLQAAYDRAQELGRKAVEIKDQYFNRSPSEDDVYGALGDYGKEMAAVAALAKGLGLKVVLEDPVYGDDVTAGVGHEDFEHWYWMPSSLCW